jgi:hypothetical protein
MLLPFNARNTMQKTGIFVFSVLCMLLVITSVSSEKLFSGTWCIGDEKLVITFKGNDSLFVSSKKDETIQGKGNYTLKDSMLIATMINEDLELKMGYRFKKKDNHTMRAKIVFFTVDGDSVNHPRRWMRMEQCNPDTFQFIDTPPSENTEE